MKRIITVQHVNGMIGSSRDWPLTEKGFRQACHIGTRLAQELSCEHPMLYASDLLRARQTAEPIAAALGLTPRYTAVLREFDLGEAVGRSKAWAGENALCPVWPGTVDWAETADNRPFTGAESRRDVWNRLAAFPDTLDNGKTVILVSHGGTLSILFTLWMGMDPESTDRVLFAGKSGGVSELLEDAAGHRILARLNDMSYIQA